MCFDCGLFNNCVAISSNLLVLSTLFLFSWYHWIETNGLKRLSRQYHNFTVALQDLANKTLLDVAADKETICKVEQDSIEEEGSSSQSSAASPNNNDDDDDDYDDEEEDDDEDASKYSDIEELDGNEPMICKRRKIK